VEGQSIGDKKKIEISEVSDGNKLKLILKVREPENVSPVQQNYNG